jgi:hypothetical protein
MNKILASIDQLPLFVRTLRGVLAGAEVTLAELFLNYVNHLEYHLRKLLGRWESGAT